MAAATVGTTRRRTGTATAATLLAAGLLFGFQSVREGIGTPSETGAGFFPFLVSVVLVLACLVVLLQERRAGPDGRAGTDPGADTVAPPPTAWGRIAGVLLASLAVPLLAETVGFVVTLSVAVAVIGKVMGMRGILRPLALGAGFGITAWYVFVYWLFVPLPAGVLGLA